jgi:flagellar biosynthesis protein FlhA
VASEGKRKTEITTPSEEVNWETVTPLDAISLEVGYRIIPLVDKTQGGELMVRIKGVRKKLTQELGFLIPTVHVRDNLSLPPDEYRIAFQGSLVGQGTVYINRQMAINPGKVSGSVPGTPAIDPTFGLPAVWIDSASREQAQLLGYTVVDPATVIATHICQLILQYSHELLSYQDTREILDQLARTMPKLVEDLTPKALPLTIIHKVLQNLLREHISIRDIRTIAECLAEHASRSQQTAALTAATRIALGRSILQQINGLDPELTVITLEPVLEQLLLQSVQKDSGEVNAEPVLVDRLSERIGEKTRRLESLGHIPVLLVSPQLRPWLAQLVRYVTKTAHVLSFLEIPEGKRIKVLDSIGVESELQQDKRQAR